LTERAVALALAVSLDNDYFSRHSQHGYALVITANVLDELFNLSDPNVRVRHVLNYLSSETKDSWIIKMLFSARCIFRRVSFPWR